MQLRGCHSSTREGRINTGSILLHLNLFPVSKFLCYLWISLFLSGVCSFYLILFLSQFLTLSSYLLFLECLSGYLTLSLIWRCLLSMSFVSFPRWLVSLVCLASFLSNPELLLPNSRLHLCFYYLLLSYSYFFVPFMVHIHFFSEFLALSALTTVLGHPSLSFSLSASVFASSRSLGCGHATFNVFTARPHFESRLASSQIPAYFKKGEDESKLLIKIFCQYWTLVYMQYMYCSVLNCV